jgi:hypothetical protein
MSKLYAVFLVIASLFAMAALGMLILVVITEVAHLVAPANNPGMNRWVLTALGEGQESQSTGSEARGRRGLGQQTIRTRWITQWGVPMANLLEQAINSNDGDRAAKIIRDALGIESDDVANYSFPKTWPADREQRARIIGEWLQTEASYLA